MTFVQMLGVVLLSYLVGTLALWVWLYFKHPRLSVALYTTLLAWGIWLVCK